MNKGLLVSIEGGEGAGKTSLIRKLVEFFEAQGVSYIQTREPGGSVIAEEIRNIIVRGNVDKLDALTETLLFNAARREHIQKVIAPALELNKVVLCDRFVDSTFVYQGYVQQVPLSVLNFLHQQACYNLLPQITYLLDVPTEIGLFRAGRRMNSVDENRFEEKGFQFHEAVRKGFLALAQATPDRVKIIDATKSEQQIYDEVIAHLNAALVK
jgi:dTMP kinase